MDVSDGPTLRVEVLGPLRLVVDGAPVEVPGPKRRAVLALLALAEGRTVPVDHLVDALWPSDAPESGRQALHTHVSRLRAHLGPAATRLQTRPDGYRLDLGDDSTSRRRGRCSRRPARTRTARCPCCSKRTRCGAGRCSPTSPTSHRSPSRSRAAPACTAR